MVKKVAKLLVLLAGMGTIVWAMRDRFISLATSREPAPPTFRTPAPQESPPVETIDGIGPVYADRLSGAGITNLGQLAVASPDLVAEAAGVSAGRARAWIEQAGQQG